ncbi:pilus assembly protein TadG-related protein [Defluviimonas sp. SAOS-178_SWC]|uniref:pilus assembly protein TadG-related protein n=1 Tax=Defluviimonas sp. SAOS-178_SWC TaxID=3121287 RepID=UPI0032218894
MALRLASAAARFLTREEGGITALSLQIFMTALVLGGLAVDFGNGIASKNQLQVAADSAAHAALYTRELHSADQARTAALQIAALNMPGGKYGTVLKPEDISFGHWDKDKQLFTVDPGSRDAVLVSTKRYASGGNGVTTYMLGLVGRNTWDVQSGSVFETYYPTCFKEGFVAQEPVEIQSNDYFTSGFCIHSQAYVIASSGNTFEPGVVVSMPDRRDIQLPNSGFTSNTGLSAALRDGSYKLRILNRVNDIIRGIETTPFDPQIGIMAPGSQYYRSYITNASPITIKAQGATSLDPTKFKTGRIHEMDCKNDQSHKQLGSGFVLRNMVLITDCRLQFASGAVIEDSVIITKNTDGKSFYASSDIVIGKDDNCATGGDVQMVTLGGVDFAAKTNIFGSQIIAVGDIALTANADGIEGVAIVSGGKLDVTSNGVFGFCDGAGMNNNYAAAYFRLAR